MSDRVYNRQLQTALHVQLECAFDNKIAYFDSYRAVMEEDACARTSLSGIFRQALDVGWSFFEQANNLNTGAVLRTIAGSSAPGTAASVALPASGVSLSPA